MHDNSWVDVLSSNIDAKSCLLCRTDSSTASGWLKKSIFADKPDEVVQLTAAQQLASIMIQTQSCLYSQWFPGEDNTVSDSLSRDFHIPSETLSHLLGLYVPEQAPFVLTILPLPTEIASWLTSLLLNQPQKEPWSKELMQSKFTLGLDTRTISSQLDYKMTPTLTTSIEDSSIKYLAH